MNADGSQDNKVTHNVTPHESFDAMGVPSTLGKAKGDPLYCASGDSLQEESGVADFSEADRTLWKQRKMSGVCLENLFTATMSCTENECMYRQSHHAQSRKNTFTHDANKNHFWTIWKSIDDLWNIDGH